MSFQRMTIIGSIPVANSEATAARTIRSASFSRRWISTSCWATVLAVAQPAQAVGHEVGGADEHLGHLLRLLHRRLDAVEPELVGGLLGVVDDVVERARQRVDVGGVEVRRARPRSASRLRISCAIRSPSCSQASTSVASSGRSG